MKKGLVTWVIYNNPSDFPGLFVVRKFIGFQSTEEFHTAESLEDVRQYISDDLVHLMADPNDDPVIVETWF